MLTSKKAKWILSKDLIETIKLQFENLRIKDLALYYRIKNMVGFDQYQTFKKRYAQKTKDKIQ